MKPASLDSVEFLLSETDPARLGESSAEVAFVGRSNVGKSSLLNAVCGGKILARVSGTPGRTRTINVFQAGLGRWIVDLPGYGFAFGDRKEIEGWQAMLESYLTGRASLRMIFVLIDAKVGPTKLDHTMLDWLESQRLPWRAVAVKADQVKSSQQSKQRNEVARVVGIAPAEMAWLSAKEGLGIREFRGAVAALLEI